MALGNLLILRRPRSGRLEGRTLLIQRIFDCSQTLARRKGARCQS
jgi:hypothetical protein